MKIEQGDLVLIPIPFTDLSSKRKRPVIVISCNKYNKMTEDIIVVGVTSNLQGETEYSLRISNDNMEQGSIRKPSKVRADKIYNLSKSIIISKFGKVDNNTLQKIKELINKALS